jgi:hypothetical protein
MIESNLEGGGCKGHNLTLTVPSDLSGFARPHACIVRSCFMLTCIYMSWSLPEELQIFTLYYNVAITFGIHFC